MPRKRKAEEEAAATHTAELMNELFKPPPRGRLFDEPQTNPRPAQHRWKVHYQFPGRPKSARLYTIKTDADKQLVKIHKAGGRAMIEDSWNEL